MDVFQLRNSITEDYAAYIQSFIHIRDERISQHVDEALEQGLLWPDPLIQLNPSFEAGSTVDELTAEGVLHPECSRVFRKSKDAGNPLGEPLRLHRHQEEAIRTARAGGNYVLTTGTGSGKSLAYIIPIVNHVLHHGSGKGIQAIIVYPMNALANSQMGELEKFLKVGYPNGRGPVTFERYTGQESDDEKIRIMAHPPDILLTNYVMLELILTRPNERRTLVKAAQGLRFLVLDELHTYRGRQGADVAMLVRRVRDALNAENMQCIGTSATVAGSGTYAEQQAEVAEIATDIFGSPVSASNVIGETLRRATPERDPNDPVFVSELKRRVGDTSSDMPRAHNAFVADPLSSWVESEFGVTAEPESDRLIRAEPKGISGANGAARKLSNLTGLSVDLCEEAIKAQLLAGYLAEPDPDTGFPVFAFRLHQFISRGDSVYASPEPDAERYITVSGQQFVPNDRAKVLLPLVFCQECGQEYYSVRVVRGDANDQRVFIPRELTDRQGDEEGDAGFLYLNTIEPWPDDADEVIRKLPDDWLEEHRGGARVRRNRRNYLPKAVRVSPDGRESSIGVDGHFLAAPFRFCLHCGISYDFRQSSDLGKLIALGLSGRSTATTILSISAIRNLRNEPDLDEIARKLLSFTDNRQDASLQAGHFNDFVDVSLLRAALYRAADEAGEQGLTHETLTQRVFDALQLQPQVYASDPEVRFQARIDTDRALRDVIGYRLYQDLRRGWRITSPNLEQCGLLEIRYQSLEEVCQAEDVWEECHPLLADAEPETRERIATVLLDFMRRELALKVDYLDAQYQEQLEQRSSQRLVAPWAIDENEELRPAKVLFPRPAGGADRGDHVYVSPRGGFGQFLRRRSTFGAETRPSLDETQDIIRQLLEALRVAGLVEVVMQPRNEDDVAGYQLNAGGMVWVAGDGSRAFHDQIRVPRLPEGGRRTNPFFVDFYRVVAGRLLGFEAREHTAQVPYDEREKREDRFRAGELPILFCSPTMELGIDIAQLNVVNMRNVPPTPANYAQRSGRAGRSGQPALVYTYCSVGSPHDQYFFKRPARMVAGAVTPPRLDVANEDLVRAHVQAIWLAETGLSLGSSLQDVLDLTGEGEPSLELLESVQADIANDQARLRARTRAKKVLASIGDELDRADWYHASWLDEAIDQMGRRFDAACDRWRGLYRAAFRQSQLQQQIILDAARSQRDRRQARRLRAEAESQLELLTDSGNVYQSDFYSYRYFASEGFLPGYNFPRLPLSAYIPARRARTARDEFLSRPRFLAISEFGPRAIVYHEGSRYIINKVIMPVREVEEGMEIQTRQVKHCPACGYLHPIDEGQGPDLCERCDEPLEPPLRPLFRLQNVSTKRRDRISSDEEERLRMGYELRTGVRFARRGGQRAVRTAALNIDGQPLAQLTYGSAATIWRINLGWRRRKQKKQFGFVLDVERGYWAKNEQQADDPDDPLSKRTERVIPYVEDHKNCLLFEPVEGLDEVLMASLTAALKGAIQVHYQLEDSELAAEPLPSRDARNLLLFYEAAEGGAGVLRRLVEDRLAMQEVAMTALELCHFDPHTGEDQRRAPRATEDCEAACYDCLMSYYNQLDHRMLDRQEIKEFLLDLSHSEAEMSPVEASREEHLAGLRNLSGSDLERQWLDYLEEHNLRLPSSAQKLVEVCHTRPDFLYEDAHVAVYVDGHHHLHDDRWQRDQAQTACMEDQGYTVLRFGVLDDWPALFEQHRYLFGADA